MSKKIMVGPVEVAAGPSEAGRMAILIWGAATCGKTTFAATAPGGKLWLSFGDNEHVSVWHRKDVQYADLSKLSTAELFKHAQSENPFGLDQILSENQSIGTVVCDSVTAISYLALQQAVEKGVGSGKRGFIPTIEEPGQSAYGGRNAIVLKVLTGLLRVTARHGVHIVITAHEADPQTRVQDGKEIVDFITMMLGGQLVNNMTWRLSEVWFMSYSHGVRRIAVRNGTRLRKPMKTRMFSTQGNDGEFILIYDADKPDKGQMTIADWYDKWIDCNGEKLKLPPNKVAGGPK